jgi:DNA-binding SARP family transcriptional activator/tetratricopeptide (TPR) repeat protein
MGGEGQGRVRYSLLGPLQVTDDDGAPVVVSGRQLRLVLTVLLVSVGRRVTAEALIDAVWGDEPPATANGTLQSYISRLRAALGSGAVVWDDAGYRLVVADDEVDHVRFEAHADRGRELLDAGDAVAARAALAEAEALWRGPALGEFADVEALGGLATRLDQRRLAALEDRFAADLAVGRHDAVAAELGETVAAHPLRERLQAQLALALYRSGRQADALRALSDAGRTLRDELGIEPSRELRDLEAAILAQDPALAAPATAAAVAPAADAAPASAGGATLVHSPLVGRDAEWAELLAALAEAAHDGRIVVVEGEPGIGKTRLVEELRAHVTRQGGTAVWGRSDEGGAAPALWPWLAPLRVLAAAVPSVPAQLDELLSGGAAAVGEVQAVLAQAIQYERFDAVTDVLADVGAAHPVAVLLDDLQWADAASLELLGYLAGRLPAGVLVVATLRQLEVGRTDAVTDVLATIARRPGSRRLRLRGLAPTATAEILGEAVAPGVASAIHARAEGNPFYALELARLLDEEGDLRGEVPASVGDVIRRRLTRLPAATLELIGVGAVVGRDVEIELLAAAAGLDLDQALDALDPAVAHRLLVEVDDRPGHLRFSHALVREVLVEDMTSLRRARVHLRVADAIEARGAGVDDVEILADHLWRAAPVGVGQRAAAALERAAEVSIRRVAYASAEGLLLKAVQLRRATGATDVDAEAELDAVLRLLEVGRALRYFQGAEADDLVERGKELARRVGRRRTLLDLMWFQFSASATASKLAETAQRSAALDAITAGDPDPAARGDATESIGIVAWMAGRIGEAVDRLDAAVALYEEAGPPADVFALERVLVSTCFWLFSHVAHGDMPVQDAWDHFDRLIADTPDRFVVASVCGFAATTALAIGDWETAERYTTTGMEMDPEAQFAFWSGQVLMHRGVTLVWRGEVDAGLQRFAQGRDLYTGVGGRSGLTMFQSAIAHQLVNQRRLDDARRLLVEARREMETYGERYGETNLLVGEALLARAAGDEDRAQEVFAAAIAVAEAQEARRLVDLAVRERDALTAPA